MAGLESDKVEKALLGKMRASSGQRLEVYHLQRSKKQISRTLLSKGARQFSRANRVAEMARQLGLESAKQTRSTATRF